MRDWHKSEPVVYHTTGRLKAKTIMNEGFRPEIGLGATSEMIQDAIKGSSYSSSVPFSRDEVTFFHVSVELARDMVVEQALSSDKVCLLVDAEYLFANHECYVADMDIVSDIIDLSVGATVESFDSIGEAARAYEESVQEVESYEELRLFDGGYAELIVVGSISPDSIIKAYE